MKRPCYLAGGTTEREDPPSESHVVTHTHNVHVRVKEGRSVAEKACVHARAGGEGMAWIERGRVYRGVVEAGEGWREVNRRCSREEKDEGSRGGEERGKSEMGEERRGRGREREKTCGSRRGRRMGWREIGRRWGGDLSEVKNWKCSMAVGNR